MYYNIDYFKCEINIKYEKKAMINIPFIKFSQYLCELKLIDQNFIHKYSIFLKN